jgi:hypothetical protein
VHRAVAAARYARRLICAKRREQVRIRRMHGTFLERSRTRVAVQAFPIVVRLIQLLAVPADPSDGATQFTGTGESGVNTFALTSKLVLKNPQSVELNSIG